MLSTTLIATIFVFGLLVLFHEFGHFITAKMVGMRVDEFAIGFGPKLISFRRGETLYSLRIIPLGGFNKIAGMDPDEEQDERSYNAKPILARMLVILAGSFMNFVLPVLIFIIIFISSGITSPSNEPILGEVIAHKSAAQAGLIAGDRIIGIDEKSIDSWREFVEVVQTSGGKVLKVHFERDGQMRDTSMIPEYDEASKRALIGVVSSVDTYRPGILESVGLAFKNTGLIIVKMIEGLTQMFTGKASADLAGPIGVAQMAGEVAQMGFAPLLQFAAFLSINLGIINLLPVPALDGGHFVTLILEAFRGKPLGPKSLQYAQMIGFVLLMGLMLFATFKDIIRLNLFG